MLALVTALGAIGLDPDLEPIASALTDLGADVAVVSWDDDTVEWNRFDAAFLRSTWDYADRVEEFRAWLERVETVTRVVNPLAAVRWSMDKHYLVDLAAAGVAIVPTTFVEVGRPAPEPDPDVEVFVVKPAVGAGSNGARRCAPSEVAAHVAVLHAAGHAAMVQPYLDLIDEQAETALVYLGDGGDLVFDHAFRKEAILTERTVECTVGCGVERDNDFFVKEEIAGREASSAERGVADAVLRSRPVRDLGALAYARVDLVPTRDGPVVLELELVEPSLHFQTAVGSAARAARAWLDFVATTLPSAGGAGRKPLIER